jgi:hypothetical protein
MAGSATFENEPRLVFRDDAIVALAGLLVPIFEARERRGNALSALELEIRGAVRRAASATFRVSDDGSDGNASEAAPVMLSDMTTAEVARRLDLSNRRVRQLATELGGRQSGGPHSPWSFVPDEVEGYATRRVRNG